MLSAAGNKIFVEAACEYKKHDAAIMMSANIMGESNKCDETALCSHC